MVFVIGRKRSASDDESEPYSKRRYNEGGHRYEVRFLVQSQVRRHIRRTLFCTSLIDANNNSHYFSIIGLYRMHEMLTVLTDVRSVCVMRLNWRLRMRRTPLAMCMGSFDAAFAKCLCPRFTM